MTRGVPDQQLAMLSTLSTEDLIPADHPIRRIRVVVDAVLAELGDTVVATAILDRLMHDAVVFSIKGPSWRLREHQALTTMATDPTERSRRQPHHIEEHPTPGRDFR